MTDPTTEFFAELARRGYEPLLANVTGTLRFDLTQGQRTDHVFVTINKGNITVSDENAEADGVVRSERALSNALTSGAANAMVATLRGTVTLEGDLPLIVSFQRLFPGPSGSRKRKSIAASREGQ
jgi:SCP-2 sterol transfer family